jgi:D-alanyl-D-alanine carboxypeptidase
MRLLSVLLVLVCGLNVEAQSFMKEPRITFPEGILSRVPSNLAATTRGGLDPVLVQKLQDTLDAMRAFYDITGFSACVITPDGDIWEGASGVNSFPDIPMQTSNALGVGSLTKTLTAAAILRLWDQGKLHPDDPLSLHIGPYPNVAGTITLRQCLTHFSGLYDYTDNAALASQIQGNSTKFWSPDEILNQYVLEPISDPGQAFSYCNTNYLLLGKVIESVGGMPYHEFVREELLEPTGLENMTLGEYENATDPRAHVWADPGFGKVDLLFVGFSVTGIFSSAWAAGAYWATAADITRWIRTLVKGEVLSPAAMALMMDVTELQPEFAYGAGLIRYRVDGIDAWGHGGNIIYKSVALHFPESGVSIAVLGNDVDFIQEGNVIAGLFLTWQDHIVSNEAVPHQIHTQLFPNPATSGSVLVGLPQEVSFRLYGTTGVLYGHTHRSGAASMVLTDAVPSLQYLDTGLYYLEVRSPQASATIPFYWQR